MLEDGPLRRDIYRVVEFRKNINPSDYYTWATIDHRSAYSASLHAGDVGGPIDQLHLSRTGAEWLAAKPNCKDH
jgi:hypothetical protein